MKFLVVLALVSGCVFFDDTDGEVCNGGPCPVTGPAIVTAPSNDVFVSVRDAAMTESVTGQMELVLDLHDCVYWRYQTSLGLGSAWFLVHPQSSSFCEMWLGGETENPGYDGHPAQYCVFDRKHTLTISLHSGGGPIVLADQPSCVSIPWP